MTERDSYGRLLPGHSMSPGRPKGVRNRIGTAFMEDMYADWKEHGKETIARMRRRYPHMYVRTYAHLVPKQLEVTQNFGDGIPTDELLRIYDYLRAVVGSHAVRGEDGHETIDRDAAVVLPPLPKTG
jgi:hypothetical protein